MTKNTLGDMHNLLLEQMERLANADSDTVEAEVERARAMAQVATAVNNNAATIIRAVQVSHAASMKVPHILTDGSQ